MTTEMLSVRELAKKYNMTEKILNDLIEEHNIPHHKEEDKVLVNVRAFDSWMASNLKHLPSENLASIESDEKNRSFKISPMLHPERVVFDPPDLTKKDILKRLVENLHESGVMEKKAIKFVMKAVIDRERLCSTAIMDGVAIPHPRASMEKYISEPSLVLAISPRGIDFESDDGKPTNLFFLICANRTDIHLKVMARLSRLLKSAKFRHELIISKDFEGVKEVFERWEQSL